MSKREDIRALRTENIKLNGEIRQLHIIIAEHNDRLMALEDTKTKNPIWPTWPDIPTWPNTPTIPPFSEPKCPVCDMLYKDMTGYVCNNPLCPTGITYGTGNSI